MGDSRSPSPRRERDRDSKDKDRSERHRRDDRDRHRDRDRDRDRRRSRSRDRDHKDRDRHRDRDRRDRDRDRDRRETSEERRERKRARREKEDRRERDRKERKERKRAEDDEWIEKGPDDDKVPEVEEQGERAAGGSGRDWMGGDDLFTGFGVDHKRKEEVEPPKPTHSKYEMNTQLLEGKEVDEYTTEEKKFVPGGPGYQWRMMKLRRLHEQADEQGVSVEDIALERYASMDEFQQALEERRFLDDRDSRRRSRTASKSGTPSRATPDPVRRMVFNDDSRPGSRQGFRRPGDSPAPGGAGSSGAAGASRVDALKRQESYGTPAKTPIPSVFTPQTVTSATAMSTEELNRLQAKVLRAKLMDEPGSEDLEKQYEKEVLKSQAALQGRRLNDQVEEEGGKVVQTAVLPTLDGQGRLYDVGLGKEEAPPHPNRRKRNQDPKFESRDKAGNIIRYNADDDEMTLDEMVRQEKFGGGSNDQKNLDAEMASQIARDGRFQADLDYMDENSERLARKRMRTDAMKRAFAINDYKRTQKALDECPYCWHDEADPPRLPETAIVALGKRTYLSCTVYEELTKGHCLIVPIQHCLSTLELDDEDWDEIRNFMKCLMRMFAEKNQGVVFYETVLSFRQQRHTVIECVQVPADVFADLPAYFRESLMQVEGEWSQHKKVIDFSQRPFRRAMVSNLPYFMVQWDYRGEKGYGHVIEGVDMATGEEGDEGDKSSGGKFPPYFAAEVIGNLIGAEPRKWMRPRAIDRALNPERAKELGTRFQPYNWTVQ